MIWLLIVTYLYGGHVSTYTAEFRSREHCEFAAKMHGAMLAKSFGVERMGHGCFPTAN